LETRSRIHEAKKNKGRVRRLKKKKKKKKKKKNY